MAEFFKMPQASPTMESGTLNAWRKAEGDALASQDVVAEVETDKAAMDVEVFEAGFLLKILAQAGEDVPAGRPIAIIGKSKDEDISALLAEFAAMKGGAAQAAPAAAQAAPAAAPVVVAELPPKATANPGVVPPAPPAPATVSTPGGYVGPTWRGKPLHHGLEEIGGSFTPAKTRRAVRSSPLARKIAEDLGVPLDRVAGSGPNGRVLRADVEAAAQAPAPQAAQAAAPRGRTSSCATPRCGRSSPLASKSPTSTRRRFSSRPTSTATRWWPSAPRSTSRRAPKV
jgi:pyruvate dehydrogenase E2 component (dihydrolipoamide acetyltransferase)